MPAPLADVTLTDLDATPGSHEAVLKLFRERPPGRIHAVCGEPSRMGRPPTTKDLEHALGVLVAIHRGEVIGALALCAYSSEQITLWGPVVELRYGRRGIGRRLLNEARAACRDGGYQSLRLLVDHRNRPMRNFALSHGLSPWKDNLIFERDLLHDIPASTNGVSRAKPHDHDAVARVLAAAFPDSGHLDRPLSEREHEGYRHHILQENGAVVGAAAVKVTPGRGWLSMIGVLPDLRGQGHGSRLLSGCLHCEAAFGAHRMGLEVLSDNHSAIRMYENHGFERSWTATIMAGPT